VTPTGVVERGRAKLDAHRLLFGTSGSSRCPVQRHERLRLAATNTRAVIEALIGGERGGAGGHLGRHAEDRATDRMVPEEHLEDQKSDVAQRDDTRQNVGDEFHPVDPCSPIAIAVTRVMKSPLAVM